MNTKGKSPKKISRKDSFRVAPITLTVMDYLDDKSLIRFASSDKKNMRLFTTYLYSFNKSSVKKEKRFNKYLFESVLTNNKGLVNFFLKEFKYSNETLSYAKAIAEKKGYTFKEFKDINKISDKLAFRKALDDGDIDLVKLFLPERLSKFSLNLYMLDVADRGYKDLVEFFADKGADDWYTGLKYAAEGGHKNIVDFFIGKGARNWNDGLYGAAKGGHKGLVKFFIRLGADDLEGAMGEAMDADNEDIVHLLELLMNV